MQRWLKLSKYLTQNGWQAVVLTPENPAYAISDSSLLEEQALELEVLKIPIWEPLHLFKSNKDKQKASYGLGGEGKGVIGKLMGWLRANLFIPDPRKFWVKPAVQFATSILEDNQIEAVITTGPPHSMHLIGYELSKATGLPWLADFRDPWSDWKILHDLGPSNLALELHRKLELKVLKQADAIVATSKHTLMDLMAKLNGAEKLMKVVYNGFDGKIGTQKNKLAKTNVLVHTGFLNEERNPANLWKAIAQYNKTLGAAEKIQLHLYGIVGDNILQELEETMGSTAFTYFGSVLHPEALSAMQQARVLLLLNGKNELSRGIVPAKTFEYLSTGNPVFYVGFKQGEVAEILNQFQHHTISGYADSVEELVQELKKVFGSQAVGLDNEILAKYHRKAQAGQIAEILNTISPPLKL